jgi:chromate transporter
MDTSQAVEATATAAPERADYTLWQLVRYFLRLGTLGFGGPVALVGYMQRDLVERRGWIAEADYKEGLALAQLCPGPLAAQLAWSSSAGSTRSTVACPGCRPCSTGWAPA